MEKDPVFERNWQLAVRIVLLVFIIVFALYVLNKLTWVISLLVIAVLIVYTLAPLTNFLTGRGIPSTVAVLLVFALLFLAAFLFLYQLIPALIEELKSLTVYLATDYRHLLPQVFEKINNILAIETVNEILQYFMMRLPNNLQAVITSLSRLTGNIIARFSEVFIVIFLVFYLLRDIRSIKKGIIMTFPQKWRKEATVVLGILDSKVGAYLRGNILRCVAVGVMTWFALTLIGMPFALMLGILAGALNIIVYIGPYLAGIPAVLLALTPNTPHPLLIIAIYVLIQAIEAFLLTPLLLGRAVDLMPFSVIVSLLVGGKLFGFLGILLAIPVAAALKVLVFHYLHGDDYLPPKWQRTTERLSAGYKSFRNKISRLAAILASRIKKKEK